MRENFPTWFAWKMAVKRRLIIITIIIITQFLTHHMSVKV